MKIKSALGTHNQVYTAAIGIRQAVFVTEQGISAQLEFDGQDDQVTHYVATSMISRLWRPEFGMKAGRAYSAGRDFTSISASLLRHSIVAASACGCCCWIGYRT